MKQDPTFIDWNGKFKGQSVPTANPRTGHAFFKLRTSPKLRMWEVLVIIAAAVLTLGALAWSKV